MARTGVAMGAGMAELYTRHLGRAGSAGTFCLGDRKIKVSTGKPLGQPARPRSPAGGCSGDQAEGAGVRLSDRSRGLFSSPQSGSGEGTACASRGTTGIFNVQLEFFGPITFRLISNLS